MVIVPVTPRGLESSVPQDRATPAPNLPTVQVRLSVGDAIVPVHYEIGAQEVAYAEPQPRLRALFATRSDHTLQIAASRDLTVQQVAAVIGQGRQAGAGAIVLQGLQP